LRGQNAIAPDLIVYFQPRALSGTLTVENNWSHPEDCDLTNDHMGLLAINEYVCFLVLTCAAHDTRQCYLFMVSCYPTKSRNRLSIELNPFDKDFDHTEIIHITIGLNAMPTDSGQQRAVGASTAEAKSFAQRIVDEVDKCVKLQLPRSPLITLQFSILPRRPKTLRK
jgi:hypothetical protein